MDWTRAVHKPGLNYAPHGEIAIGCIGSGGGGSSASCGSNNKYYNSYWNLICDGNLDWFIIPGKYFISAEPYGGMIKAATELRSSSQQNPQYGKYRVGGKPTILSALPPEVRQYYNKDLLLTPIPTFIWEYFMGFLYVNPFYVQYSPQTMLTKKVA